MQGRRWPWWVWALVGPASLAGIILAVWKLPSLLYGDASHASADARLQAASGFRTAVIAGLAGLAALGSLVMASRVHRREGRRAADLELPHQVWLPAVSAAGLAPLRPHDLRHTAVALWIAAGASPKEVSVRAGHTSSASRWTATATCSRVTTPSCATAWTPCTLKGCRAR
jgi:hypothetical protein